MFIFSSEIVSNRGKLWHFPMALSSKPDLYDWTHFVEEKGLVLTKLSFVLPLLLISDPLLLPGHVCLENLSRLRKERLEISPITELPS